MKKYLRSILCLLMALSVVFCFAACSDNGKDDEDDEDEIAGTYVFHSCTYDGETATVEDMEEMAEYYDLDLDEFLSLTLDEDGTGTITLMGEDEDIEWDEDGTMWPEGDEDDTVDFKVKNGKLTLEIEGYEYVFKKK